MKQNFVRMKTRAKSVSLRTLALVMGVVMLLSAIGVGSTLSAYAVSADESTRSGALSAAAVVGGDIADQIAQFKAPVIAEANAALRGDKADLADTGANVDVAGTGYSDCFVSGDWDDWKFHSIYSNNYSVSLSANSEYHFVFKGDNNDYFKNSAVTVSETRTDLDFPLKDGTESTKLKTTVAGEYIFHFKHYSGTSVRVDITFPAAETVTTWTAVGAYGEAGDSTPGFFGSAWEPTATANDMALSTGTTYTKTWSNVSIPENTTIYYKVAKNHSWDESYGDKGNNLSYNVTTAGTYNVTISFDSSTKTPSISVTPVAQSRLTIANSSTADVSATVNGISVAEGASTDNVTAGSKVTVTTTPVVGNKVTGVTYTANDTTTSATALSGGVYTFDMPAAATTVNVTTEPDTIPPKDIYFNNMNTLYSKVFAYIKYDNGTEPFGPYPGKAMTRLDNSNIWKIEIPGDAPYITFRGDDGANTNDENADSTKVNSDGMMKIPWDTSHTKALKYTAPYGHNSAPTLTNGGTWGEYKSRDNEMTVTDGTNMDRENIFTGISATFYDYYTDHEVTGSWRTYSTSAPYEYSVGNGSQYLWNPYTKLNAAISKYSATRNVSYPLYFGNLNLTSHKDNDNTKPLSIDDVGGGSSETISGYHGWDQDINNSINLSPDSKAITGLTGQTLINSNIHSFDSTGANQNGVFLPMFDEDFLSGENDNGETYAKILRSSSFPVRQNSEYLNKVYIDPGAYDTGGAKLWAAFFHGQDTNDGQTLLTTKTGNYYVVDIPDGATRMVIARLNSDSTNFDWKKVWNQTVDITLPSSTSAARVYSFDNWAGYNNKETFTVSNVDSKTIGTPVSHTYYEFDSKDGKDNAYITNVSGNTAKLSYYAAEDEEKKFVHAAKVADNDNTQGDYGFFPFDFERAAATKTSENLAHDLGFGMKLEIPFTLGEGGLNADGTPQTFFFSGDDDLWVFIDGELVLDLGGAHTRTTGTINFNTKEVDVGTTPKNVSSSTRNGKINIGTTANDVNTVHTMTIYYMERGMYDSNLKFGFSFHAIPDMVMVDKKVRTNNVNPGFFNVTSQTGASNESGPILNDKGKQITKFEHTYQASYNKEKFGITQTSNNKPTNNGVVTYTIDSGNPVTENTSLSNQYQLQYDLFNDQVAYFVGQYDPSASGSNSTITLSESIPENSLYRYDSKFTVYNVANNNSVMGENTGTSGFFNIPEAKSTGLNDIRVRARFTNEMKVHSLALTKEITNTADSTTDFTFKVLFKFGDYGYLPFTLDCTVDGVGKTLSENGTISIKAGQTLIIPNIPENAKVQVTEVLGSDVTSYSYEGFTMKDSTGAAFTGTTDVNPTSEKGVQFTMGDKDLSATVQNSKPQYKYTIKYTYQSYGETPKTQSLYGNQSYTVSGVFTDNEALANLTNNGGNISFLSGKEKNFVISKAPYEDNFMQTLSFADSTLSNNEWTGNAYYCELTAIPSSKTTVNVKFKLPYTVAENDKSFTPVENSNQQIEMKTAVEYDAGDVTVYDHYKYNNAFVKVPLIIYDGSTPKYFQYWKVSKQSSFGMKGNPVYTRCYDYEFNLSIFMDCVIEPVYASTWAQSNPNLNPVPPANYKDYGRFDPEIQIDTTAPITIAFLENSRNQYNNGDKGTRTTTNQAMDVIYSDFLLSYNYAFGGYGKLSERNDVMCGLIVEAVNYMESTDGSFNYTADYSNNNNYAGTVTKEQLEAWILNGHPANGKPQGCGIAEFASTKLDNKNRIQYYYSLSNRKLDAKTGNLLNTLQNRYKVFKAYAYAVEYNSGTYSNVQISAPVYFTIYDVGQNGLPDNVTQ